MTQDLDRNTGLDLVAILGAGDAEVVALAELHRNPRVFIVGVYDPDPDAVGHELCEILGLSHSHSRDFLDQIASAAFVVAPRDRHQYADVLEFAREKGCRILGQAEALERYSLERRVERPPTPTVPMVPKKDLGQLEDSLRWLEMALDRENLLRSLLSIAVQSVGASKGSIQLFDPFTQQLYIAYADGLSDHTVRASRQCLGEGIAGRVAATRRAELLRGADLAIERRDRPDIQSAICAPLEVDGELLGVINVSTDHGESDLTRADLDRLGWMAERIGPVLRRLLQIQVLLDSSLVQDLERELDALFALDAPITEALALTRDLVEDLSGAQSASLIVLGEDGPAFQLHPGRDEKGAPLTSRRLDPHQGILGQVLLDGSPVVLEERNRPAGESKVRREMTLYLPIGGEVTFAVLLLRFGGLSTLSHFQRNLDGVRDALTPRLGAMLSRHESRHRHERLRRLATGLSQLVAVPESERPGRAATLFMELTGAEAVAVWRPGSAVPDTELLQTRFTAEGIDQMWNRLRERLQITGLERIREVDPVGSELRSLLLVGESQGAALAALNRRPEDGLSEWGFREEDLECAALLLEAMATAPELVGEPPHPPRSSEQVRSTDPRIGRRLLEEELARELDRAQRYHLGFSLNVFLIVLTDEQFVEHEAEMHRIVEQSSRATDAVLWLEGQQLAILAPEEMRGQRQLVRRVRDLLEGHLTDILGPGPGRIEVRTAAFPRDAESAAELIERCVSGTSD